MIICKKKFFQVGIQAGLLLLSTIVLVFCVWGFSTLFEVATHFAKQSVSQGLWHMPFAVLAFVTGAYLCRRFAPLAAGSGIPRVRDVMQSFSQNNTLFTTSVLGVRTLVVKVVGCLVCAAGGGALGREGPIVHISASIFWLISARLQRWFPWIQPQRWIMMGSAIGFTAAFHAPIAAVAFVVEELNDRMLSLHDHHLLWAILCAGLVLFSLQQDVLFFSTHVRPTFTLDFLPPLLVIALVCGILAALLLKTEQMMRRHIFDRFSPFVVAGVTGVLVSMIALSIGPNTIGGGLTLMQDVLAGRVAPSSVADVLGRFVNTLLTLISGNAGGTLAPALALGGGVGGVFAGLGDSTQTTMFILLGMGAFLAALLDIPFTATILIIETTGHPHLVAPLLLASLVSTHLARLIKL
jgi:H+/Cl- antiporter ClcA